MMRVIFIQPNGRREEYEARPGDTILDVALDNGVEGIIGQCGGGCTCCTCHCWVRRPGFDDLNEPHRDELEMLDYAWQKADNSRLSCQVELGAHLDVIEVDVPSRQS